MCAIVSIPLYGYIEVKLSLIAQAFFDQGDFSNIEIIKTAYEHLNVCLCENSIDSSPMKQIYVGLPVRDIILRYVRVVPFNSSLFPCLMLHFIG